MIQVAVVFLSFCGLCVILYLLTQLTLQLLFTLLHRLVRLRSIVYGLIALVLFPGTLIHEGSHAVSAIVLNLKVREIKLMPSWSSHTIKFGRVQFERKDPVRGIIVGISPIFFGYTALFLLAYLLPQSAFLWQKILIIYLIFSISTSMFSSSQDMADLKGSFPFIIATVFIMLVGVLCFRQQIRLFFENNTSIMLSSLFTLISVNIFTLVIHLIVISFVKILLKIST